MRVKIELLACDAEGRDDRLSKTEHEHRRALEAKQEADLEALRILVWCVQRNRYSAEPVRIDGGRRGKARIATFTFYLEIADLAEAREAVKEIV